ncbi:MAG: efflux RND transporter periplasmic adaptor subunit, partial [Balneolales bacterium]|nr:efflux RND transporter periplasmic adaptor subunit [Balneolales bacterium]
EVSISMVAYPDHNFTGEIVRLSSALDPNRRTLEAIIELPNPDYLLKPGMFATVDVKVPVQDPNPAIHKQSLIFDNNNHYVVVYRDPCDVEVRQVLISSRSGDNVFIESGVREGEQVATNNHLLIFNELTLNGTR